MNIKKGLTALLILHLCPLCEKHPQQKSLAEDIPNVYYRLQF
jgi:hypothetical protein